MVSLKNTLDKLCHQLGISLQVQSRRPKSDYDCHCRDPEKSLESREDVLFGQKMALCDFSFIAGLRAQ